MCSRIKDLLDGIKKANPDYSKKELYLAAIELLKEEHFSSPEWVEVMEDLWDRIFSTRQ
ncbi:MAG: hypothetical protein ACHQEM_12445 [Chitinophagales bacterium]